MNGRCSSYDKTMGDFMLKQYIGSMEFCLNCIYKGSGILMVNSS